MSIKPRRASRPGAARHHDAAGLLHQRRAPPAPRARPQVVGQLRIGDLDAFASRKLAEGYAPSTVNRIQESLRSALSTAVRKDRLTHNLARYGGGVAAARPTVDHELTLILRAARDEHFFPIILLLARTGLRVGEACGLRWRDLNLGSVPPRLTVVWQLDRWGELVHPKTATARTVPLRAEVAAELEA